MTIHDTLEEIQGYFSTRESMLHWLFWLRASYPLGLSSEIILEECAYKCLDDKHLYAGICLFTQLFGVEHWKVSFCVEDAYRIHKEGAYPIWSQGDKYYIPELDEVPQYEWDSDEELPF